MSRASSLCYWACVAKLSGLDLEVVDKISPAELQLLMCTTVRVSVKRLLRSKIVLETARFTNI